MIVYSIEDLYFGMVYCNRDCWYKMYLIWRFIRIWSVDLEVNKNVVYLVDIYEFLNVLWKWRIVEEILMLLWKINSN